ncbi:armadillo-type protein [Catenaria anguillulae PL171]|uniref:26S proteasome regulatory subunit RPN1 n=1 Tax=Catenaria anguillulae PL171 TaxID=765915 RepID=A0A1Y2HVV8_9FUNG|nr:armadillo-type protein [Catenaria anguillulae PL171]
MTNKEKDIVNVDPVSNDDPQKEQRKPHVDSGKPQADTLPEDDLSEEDKQLKDELDLLVLRLTESDRKLHRPALESLRTLIRSSTSSMTSVPKPLKFLRPHYPSLKLCYDQWPQSEDKLFLADVLSVLGMTYAEEGVRDSIKYRLLGTSDEVGSWGHEYVRHLAAEIGEEYAARIAADADAQVADLLALADQITPFFLKHNAEADAVDLLLELEVIDRLVPHVDKNTVARVGLYMISCVPYLPYPEDETVLRAAHAIYRNVGQVPEALVLAMRLDDKQLMQQDFEACTDPVVRKQLAYMLARHSATVATDDDMEQEILANTKLSEHFLALAQELGITDPKTPDDIYKTHLEARNSAMTMDSAKQNLASSLVNAFVNCGFAKDKLMLVDDPQWIYKNKDHAMVSATASLGMLMLWDVQGGLTHIDKYMYSTDDNIKAGGLLAVGLVSANVRDENEPAMALLAEHLTEGSTATRLAAITGLGIAYAGTAKAEVGELLSPLLVDNGEISCHAALALGLIFSGTCDGDLTSQVLQVLMEHPEKSAAAPAKHKLMGLGLALLYLGKQEACEATVETLKAIESPMSRPWQVLVETCAYAGTGNVLKVQAMTRLCSEQLSVPTTTTSAAAEGGAAASKKDAKEKESKDKEAAEAAAADWQGLAVLGMAMVAMGEDVGAEMMLRTYNHLMHYGTPAIRKCVPLAIALQCASNPVVTVLDTLSKFSHDHDIEVAVNAIFAMGMVGAGTNNARLAQMLRQLASYYNKDPSCLFMVRVAQGMVHMGKGTVTVNPYHTNRSLLSRVALGGLLTVLVAMTDAKHTILGKSHWMLYHLASAMYPRMLLVLDEELKPKSVSVRVGQAVDVVGQAGRPKTITGFQTHNTPVLMAYGERAELATEEFVTLTPVVEGFVVVRKNPEYMEEDKE